MAKTNDFFETYVDITPYKGGCNYNKLELRTTFHKGFGICVHVQPFEIKPDGNKACMMMCFDPVEDGLEVARIPLARKNAKLIEETHNKVVSMGDKIADLWNKRDFEGIKSLFK